MGLIAAMGELAQQWDEVLSGLEPGQARTLRELVARFVAEDGPGARADAAEDIMSLLVEALPVAHPVLRALRSREDRFRGPASPAAWRELAVPLRVLLSSPPGTTFGDDDDDAGPASPPAPGGPTGGSFGDHDDDR